MKTPVAYRPFADPPPGPPYILDGRPTIAPGKDVVCRHCFHSDAAPTIAHCCFCGLSLDTVEQAWQANFYTVKRSQSEAAAISTQTGAF